MNKTIWSLSLIFLAVGNLSLSAQNTLILKFEGLERPKGPIFLAGNFNQWNPADSNFLFIADTLRIDLSMERIEAKLTGGSWDKAEADANGGQRPNRSILLENRDTIALRWYAWEKHEEHPPRGVELIESLDYYGGSKKVWVYLPPAYINKDQRFPVFYLHDAQNLFSGLRGSDLKWRLAHALDSLNLPLIIVGIEHGGVNRINELSLFKNGRYGGGQGIRYLQYIEEVLIPYIDSNYRSIRDARFRFIGGSSLGGLISMSALAKFPNSFSGALVFSPAYWFNPEILSLISTAPLAEEASVYQMIGDSEGDHPAFMIDQMYRCDSILKERRPHWQLQYKVVAGGQHNEDLWQAELPEALIWFFRQAPLKEYLENVRGSR